MCGIAGVYATGADANPTAALRGVTAMTAALSHRGPDGHGSVLCTPAGFTRGVVAFGHARLAVIDLSERASQPMAGADGALWLTYNGEVYNYRALRAELERDGASFTSNSDTEVVLRAYERWGESCIERLDGMFALALWDSRASRLLLARDRMGIKPLYVYRAPGLVAFASEIRSLLASGLVPRALDLEGLDQYLACQTTVTPRTLVRHVSMLPAGSTASFEGEGREATRAYWHLLPAVHDAVPLSRADAVRRVADLLTDAVRSHLVSDVPVGVFLSSGLDSTAIAAVMRSLGTTPHTFTLSVPGLTGDEGPEARRLARAVGAEHHETVLTPDEVRAAVEAGVQAFDHPSGDGLNSFVIARAVRSAGLKVALSGLGGDEIFGGYPSFARLLRMGRYAPVWRRLPASVRRAAGRSLRRLLPPGIQADKACDLLATDFSVPGAYPILRQLFGRAARRDLLSPEAAAVGTGADDPYTEVLLAEPGFATSDTMTQVACAEARTYMHDVLLRDVDQMSMHHGLEVRVPWLDHRLVHAVMAMPQRFKRPAPAPKALFHDAVRPLLPSGFVQGPKRGFVLPFDRWMNGELHAFVTHHLGDAGLAGRRFMRREGVAAVWNDFTKGRPATTWSRPWALVALNAWLEGTGVDL